MTAALDIASTTSANLRRRGVTAGASAAFTSSIAAVVTAQIAEALGVAHEHQLRSASLIFTTIVGVAIGTVGWIIICQRSPNPSRTLRRLVPIVLVLSFIPDILIGLSGTTFGAAVTLGVAHVSVFAATLPLLALLLAPATFTKPAPRGSTPD